MSTAVDTAFSVLRANSKSFALAARLLPKDCRADAAVVYAYCRRVDDAVDDVPPALGRLAVQGLEDELERVYRGARLDDDGLLAFREVVERREIPREYPRALLLGMRMDVDGMAYETLSDLRTYCFRAAGTVGLMMCHVLGVRNPRALEHAADLGIAMQLTNVCRDVHEDWQRGRLYLPRELLREVSLGTLDPERQSALTPAAAHGLRPVVRRLLELGDSAYASGDRGLVHLAPRCAFAVRAARLIYSAIGSRIAQTGYDVLAGRAHVPLSAKLALCARAFTDTLWSHSFFAARFERAALTRTVEHVANRFPL